MPLQPGERMSRTHGTVPIRLGSTVMRVNVTRAGYLSAAAQLGRHPARRRPISAA
jgi:hypothetical protein